jgi:hypothetical protein
VLLTQRRCAAKNNFLAASYTEKGTPSRRGDLLKALEMFWHVRTLLKQIQLVIEKVH